MINKMTPITIRAVSNGYIVEGEVKPAMCVSDMNTMVFNEMSTMSKWIKSHFAEDKIPERDLKPGKGKK